MTTSELDRAIAAGPHALLDQVLGDDSQSAFQDSDGLISFVNMSSSLVTNNPQYTTGRAVCDQICNFYSTLRIKVFSYLQSNPGKVLPGDTPPATQWDAAVTHYIQFLLAQSGGLAGAKVVTMTYSYTQVLAEFSTSFVQMIFDAAVVPEAVIQDVTNFLQGVGQSLRASWDDRSRTYSTSVMGQCHEAVPVDATGETLVYFPKVKYYYISIDSSQQEFSTSCSSVEKITFNFNYEYYVSGLQAAVLDTSSQTYQNFSAFLAKAQQQNYKDANNTLDSILGDTTSNAPATKSELGAVNAFGVNFEEYPRVVRSPESYSSIEDVLNRRPGIGRRH